MIILYYLGLLFSVFSILSAYPVFQDQDIPLSMLLIIVSFLMFYLFCRSTAKEQKKFSLLLKTIYVFFLTVTFEILGVYLYIEFFSRWRTLAFLTPVFRWLFSLAGVSTGFGNGSLYINGVADYTHTFLPNPGNLGLIYFIMITLGLLPLFLITKNWRNNIKLVAVSILSLGVYLFFRTMALISLFCLQEVGEYGESWHYLTLFWHSVTGLISFLPWVLFQAVFFRGTKVEVFQADAVISKDSFRKHLLPSLSLGLAVFLCVLLVFWVPSGRAKQGRVLLEEYYSDWSKSTKPIDEEWYNSASTYYYYTLRIYLNAFYEMDVNEQPLENVDLDKYDVLVIKIPTKPYSGEVIKKIVSYVRKGGGLWVIGDHTNVFGSSTYLNSLLKPFGIKLCYDAIYQNVHGSFNRMHKGNLVEHPIIHKVPVFLYATPCSIQVSNPAIRIADAGLTTKSYSLNYGKDNFFPDTKPDLNIIFGSNTLLAAGDFGKGRIAVFSDSTVFSNFFIMLPGKIEMALSVISWLNHYQAPFYLKVFLLLVILALCLGFISLYGRINNGQRYLFWPLLIAVFFLAFAIPLVNLLNRISFHIPQEKTVLTKVGYIGEYSSIYLPFAAWQVNPENDLNTFYIWGQRVGVYSRYYTDLTRALKETKTVFIILPRKKFNKPDLEKIDAFLHKGGKVFVMDDGGTGSSANSLLEKYGISLACQNNGQGRIYSPHSSFSFDNSTPVGVIRGGDRVILFWEDLAGNSYPVFVVKEVGKGILYTFGGIQNFTIKQFGHDGIVPTGNKKKINDLILDIYRLTF